MITKKINETIKRFREHPGVRGVIVMSNEGLPISADGVDMQKAEKEEDKTWGDIGNWTGDDIVKVIPGDNGNVIEAIAINMDSYSLKRYLSRGKVNTAKAVSFARNKFFSSVYLHSLFLYSIFDKLKRQEEYEAIDIEELLPTLMKPYSSFLIHANTDEEILNSFAED